MNWMPQLLERVGEAMGIAGAMAGIIILLVSYLLQNLLVVILIGKFFQDAETRAAIPFLRALGYALLFTTATPVACVAAGILLIYSFPYSGWLWDPISRLPDFDSDLAIESRPIAWVLTLILAIISYFIIKRHYKIENKHMFKRHYLWILFWAIIFHFVCQFSVYVAFLRW